MNRVKSFSAVFPFKEQAGSVQLGLERLEIKLGTREVNE
jgi:hypothetical protein